MHVPEKCITPALFRIACTPDREHQTQLHPRKNHKKVRKFLRTLGTESKIGLHRHRVWSVASQEQLAQVGAPLHFRIFDKFFFGNAKERHEGMTDVKLYVELGHHVQQIADIDQIAFQFHGYGFSHSLFRQLDTFTDQENRNLCRVIERFHVRYDFQHDNDFHGI